MAPAQPFAESIDIRIAETTHHSQSAEPVEGDPARKQIGHRDIHGSKPAL
jgi:hypothetical protein